MRALPVLMLLLLLLLSATAISSSVSGPGLRPSRVVLPCRYFWITKEEKEDDDDKTSSSIPPPVVTITGLPSGGSASDQGPIRLRSELLPMEEQGLFLARYQTRATLSDLKITVDGEETRSEEDDNVFVQPHGCRCPQEDFELWMRNFGCGQELDPQIEADFAPFEEIDMETGLAKAIKEFASRPGTHSFCHYAIVDNQIHRRCYGQHVGFKMFPDSTFSILTNMVRLPDVEFLINLGDWPLVRKSDEDIARDVPMLSWCKTNDTNDILLPTYELTEASTECMGRQILDLLSTQGKANLPWDQREDKAFFKGRDSSRERLKLARLAKSHPHLIEGGITRYFFFRDEEDRLGTVQHSSFFDFFKYKYQISLDGTVAAYRLPFLLAGGSLILKQDSPYFEHFYVELEPWVHYVPVKKDLSDLIDKLHWARSHDAEARSIAARARDFARRRLMPREVLCYHAKVVQQWEKRLRDKRVVPREGMEALRDEEEGNKQGNFNCHCQPSEAEGGARDRSEL